MTRNMIVLLSPAFVRTTVATVCNILLEELKLFMTTKLVLSALFLNTLLILFIIRVLK